MSIATYALRRSSMAACILLGTVGAAMGQSVPTNEELGKRLDQLQMKLDALIELQMKNASSASATASSASVPSPPSKADTPNAVPASSGYRKGLTLDLYLEPDLGAHDMGRLLPIPKDFYPSASAVVKPERGFEWAAFTEVEQMKRFAEPMEKRVGLNWSGYINIPATGPHVFALEMAVDNSSSTNSCLASLMIDQHEVVRVVSVEHYNSRRLSSNQGSINLAAGYHEFSLFGYCSGDYPKFDRIHFNVLTKGPTDRAPKPVTAESFVTRG